MSSRAEIDAAPREVVLAPLGDVMVGRTPTSTIAPAGAAASAGVAAPVGIAAPAGVAADGAAAVKRTRLWIEALVVIWLCWVYDAISNLAPLRLHAALAHALGILRLERALHLDPELTLNRWLSAHHALGLVVSDYYDNAHFIVTLGLLGWLWYARPDIYRPLRNTLVAINVVGFLIFWLYPVAPPRMLLGIGFDDVVAATHALGSWHTGALASAANQLAAMPSLHMAWATWCTLAMWRLSTSRWVRGLAIVYPCATAVAVLSTGNHFLADVLAGVASTALVALLVGAVERSRPSGFAWRVAPVTNLLRSR